MSAIEDQLKLAEVMARLDGLELDASDYCPHHVGSYYEESFPTDMRTQPDSPQHSEPSDTLICSVLSGALLVIRPCKEHLELYLQSSLWRKI